MSPRVRKENPTEEEIDRIVIAQADDNSAWEKPVRVRRTKPTTVTIPAELAARVAFLARLHRKTTVEEWVTRIIEDRVEIEEGAFAGAKRELTTHAGQS